MSESKSTEKNEVQSVYIGPKVVEIPSEWRVTTIDSLKLNDEPICYGVLKPGSDVENGIPLIKIEDLEGNRIASIDTVHHITEELHQEFSRSRISGGEVLISVQGTIGRVAIVPHEIPEANISRTVARITPNEKANPVWLKNFLLSNEAKSFMEIVSSGSTRSSLNIGTLRDMKALVPPLHEQRRIADILSTIDEQIQQTDEMIEKTKEVKRGLMQDLLTKGIGHDDYEERYLGPRRLEIPRKWNKARLEEVSQIITRGKQPTYVEEGGVPVLNQSCIYWDGFHPEGLKRLDSKVADDWKDKYWVKEGDVLINSTGKGTLGRALEWTKESDTHALDSHITRVHPDESVLDPTYFRFYLESNHGQKMLYAFCVAGSTGQIELSKTDLQTMPILLPPIEEQREISEAFHRVNKKLQDEQETKEELQELKRGLMQDLLTGKVRVNTD